MLEHYGAVIVRYYYTDTLLLYYGYSAIKVISAMLQYWYFAIIWPLRWYIDIPVSASKVCCFIDSMLYKLCSYINCSAAY